MRILFYFYRNQWGSDSLLQPNGVKMLLFYFFLSIIFNRSISFSSSDMHLENATANKFQIRKAQAGEWTMYMLLSEKMGVVFPERERLKAISILNWLEGKIRNLVKPSIHPAQFHPQLHLFGCSFIQSIPRLKKGFVLVYHYDLGAR